MPHLPFFISTRYLLAKKSHNTINIITGISVSVLTLGTTALILILSVFNGLENVIADLYNSSRPDVIITPAKGKFMSLDTLPYQPEQDLSVNCWSPVVEDMALAKYSTAIGSERQSIVKLKGVKGDYHCMSGIDTLIYDGTFLVEKKPLHFAVVSYGAAARLDLRLNNPGEVIHFYYPRADASPTDMLNAFTIESAIPSGIIYLQSEEDDFLMYVSINFARKLLNLNPKQASSLELQLKDEIDEGKFVNQLKEKLGANYTVQGRLDFNATLYKITQSEKWAGFLILAFILLLAAFNVVGSLTVLIVEKKDDIQVFMQMGGTKKLIKRIFLYEGLLITLAGGFLGMLLGLVLVLLQQTFGLIPMEGGFAIDSFPVALKAMDFVWVGLLIVVLGILSTAIPVSRMKRFLIGEE